MENLIKAAQYTQSTLSIIPLIAFCFLPVWQDRKTPAPRLFIKVVAAFCGVESVMFFIYLLFPMMAADILNELLCIVVFFYLYQREFALERTHLWFIFMTACMIGGFSFLLYHLVDIVLHPAAIITDPGSQDSFLLQIVFEVLLVILLIYPSKKHLNWLVHHFHAEKVWKVIWLIPFGFMVFSSIFIPYDNSNMQTGRFLEVYVFTILVLFGLIILIYVLFFLIAYSFIENQNMIQKAANLEIQVQQYHKLQAYVQETSRLRHDFRHQLTVFAEMLKKQRYKELEEYLKQYISSVSDMPVRYCTSSAVNAILNHYAALSRELNITTHFSIRLQKDFSVEDIDFCVLLGNLLENAIDSCKLLSREKRQISLMIGQTAEHVIALQISNPYEGSLTIKENRLFSSKHEGEGLGLKSARLIAEKYNGFFNICSEGQIFEVKVLLNF